MASKYRRRRVHLKAHDRGDNRHAKAVAWLRKRQRNSATKNNMRSQKRRVVASAE